LAFTITTNVGGTAATVVGTNSSDSIAAAQLANISSLSLTAFDADDVVITGTTALSASGNSISVGQGDDQVTLSAGLTGSGSLVDLGEGADTFTAAGVAISSSSIRGLGGLDTITINGAATIRSVFVNGNVGGDRINFGGANNVATVFASSTIVGGSEDDRITFNTSGTVTGGRVNGQDGDDVITVTNIGAGTTTTMFGGQGNDTLTAGGNTFNASGDSTALGFVIFSGDLGNDTLTGAAQGADLAAGALGGGDLLFGGGGNDTISTGNRGQDTLTGGDGNDTFVISNATDGFLVAYTDVTVAGVVSAGDTFNLNDTQGVGSFNNFLTNIADFAAGDVIDTANGTNAISGLGLVFTDGAATGVNGVTYKFAGSYNAANSTFTVTADNLGTDTLILLNGGGNGGANSHILLKGTSASSLVPSNFV
jgi:Ca2+-binding RTX toxin-like protein